MKNFFFIILFSLSLQPLSAQKRLENLGLVSELQYIKTTSENYLNSYLDNPKAEKAKVTVAITNYLEIKSIYDQLTLQLIADLKACGNMKTYNRIDKLLLTYKSKDLITKKHAPAKLKQFCSNLKEADILFEKNILNQFDKDGAIAMMTETDNNRMLGGAAALSADAISGIIEAAQAGMEAHAKSQQDKVDAMCKILRQLMFEPISLEDKE